MRVAVLLLCLLGSAALWLWAWAPWEAGAGEPPPAEFCGEFRMSRFVQPQGSGVPDPFQTGQRVLFDLREDGTFLYRSVVDAGYEIDRTEGTLRLDEDGRLVLRQHSRNRAPVEGPPQLYRPVWIEDDDAGRLLTLTAIPEGYVLELQPVD